MVRGLEAIWREVSSAIARLVGASGASKSVLRSKLPEHAQLPLRLQSTQILGPDEVTWNGTERAWFRAVAHASVTGEADFGPPDAELLDWTAWMIGP